MSEFYSPELTEYTVVFRCHPRPDGARSFRRVFANNEEEAIEGLFKLSNTSNIIEVTDCFATFH